MARPKNVVSIYVITNIVNGKQYVGITNSLTRRWASHRKAEGRCPALHNAIKAYGLNAFVFTHLMDVFDIEYAKEMEKQLIIEKGCKAPSGYNISDGGESRNGVTPWNKGMTGGTWPESRRNKPSPLKGKKMTEEQKQKLRKPKSAEHAAKIRAAKQSLEGREANRRAGLARAKKAADALMFNLKKGVQHVNN
jgi:group I intron endonuclease